MYNSGGSKKGFVWVEIKEMAIYSCYIPPNRNKEAYEDFLNRIGNSLKKNRKKGNTNSRRL